MMAKQLLPEQVIACGIEPETAALILPQIHQCFTARSPVECWQHLTQSVLQPHHPFALHQLLYSLTFADWGNNQSSPPAWTPTQTQIQQTNIAALMHEINVASYPELHAWSVQNRAEFWHRMMQRLEIKFHQSYTEVLDCSQGVEHPKWLVNGRLNIVESCFQATADSPAIVFHSEEDQLTERDLTVWSYAQLHALTNRVANSVVEAGFRPGDAIAIAMPMTAESVAIYLGIIKAGGVVVSIADSFAANEIATRLQITKAKAIFTQDYIQRSGRQLPLYDKVIAADAPLAIVLPCRASATSTTRTLSVSDTTLIQEDRGNQPLTELHCTTKLRSGDLTWHQFLSDNDQFTAVATHPSAHTNILFSSGTTGEPKAIPWTQTTPIKCAVDGHLHHDIHAGDVVAWSTNLGWMMGPWLIYASLINRGTIALYNGAPTVRGYGQFIQAARVNLLGVVPSLVSSWKTSQCMHGLDWSAIKAFSSTGECSNPQDMLFLMSLAGYKPIIEYCGGTEIGGGYITGTMVQPASPATFTTPALGLDLVILNGDGQPTDKGEALIIPPSIGLSTELLNKDHHQVYFTDTPDFPTPLRRHGDQLERLPNAYYRAHGRVDDTMNLGGIKVSTAELEAALITVEGICETAAIAVSPVTGGPSQLVIYAVIAEAQQLESFNTEDLKNRMQQAIRSQLNPLFKIHDVVLTETLPRTASNKLMRRVLRDQYKQSNQTNQTLKNEVLR